MAPAAVTNLAATNVSTNTITLSWTAPGDDGNTGTASSYDLRYTTEGVILSDTDFSNATRVAGVPAPQTAGSAETFTMSSLTPSTTYFFGIKTADEVANTSGLSNSPKGITSAVSKYSISKSTGDNQIVVVSSYTAPMVSLVKDVDGNAARDIALTFSISTWPAGAIGYKLTKSSGTTSPQGLADVQLKLGNIPAEYGVTATCASCEASASSVTFTCCGKLKNDDFKQFDLRWSTTSYDNICYLSTDTAKKVHNCQEPGLKGVNISSFTIGAKGCSLSAMATLINYYAVKYPESSISSTTPVGLNRALGVLGKKGFDSEGGVQLAAIKLVSKDKFVYDEQNKIDISPSTSASARTTALAGSADLDFLSPYPNPVIFRFRRTKLVHGKLLTWSHFVLAVGKCGNKYILSDPGGVFPELVDPNGIIVRDSATQDTAGPLTGVRRFRRSSP